MFHSKETLHTFLSPPALQSSETGNPSRIIRKGMSAMMCTRNKFEINIFLVLFAARSYVSCLLFYRTANTHCGVFLLLFTLLENWCWRRSASGTDKNNNSHRHNATHLPTLTPKNINLLSDTLLKMFQEPDDIIFEKWFRLKRWRLSGEWNL